VKFDWDAEKARINLAKHGVSFEEAETVFAPAKPAIFEDMPHSDAQWRYVAIGFSAKQRLLAVFFAREEDLVRIISARKATKNEEAAYGQALRQGQ